MTQDQGLSAIAESLVKGVPLSYKFYADGHLVVIAPSGKKFSFTTGEVQAVKKELCAQKSIESVLNKKVSRSRKTQQKDPSQGG